MHVWREEWTRAYFTCMTIQCIVDTRQFSRCTCLTSIICYWFWRSVLWRGKPNSGLFHFGWRAGLNWVVCCRAKNRSSYIIWIISIFLPRDAMRKRGLCCRPVSVRLSRSCIVSIHTAEDIVKLLSRPSSPVILVFWLRAPLPNSQENRFSGVLNTPGWSKFATFDWNRRLSRKRYEIGSWLLRNRVGSDDLEWPWKAVCDGSFSGGS